MRFFKLVEIDEKECVERTGDLDFNLYLQTNNKANDIYPDDKNVYIATDENEEEISVELDYFDKENSMSKERYAEHTVAWELPNRDSVTKGNYNLADIETKYLPIQTEVVSDNKDQTINKLQQRIAELEEQLKNAIVPKFKVGQEIWGITPLMSWKIKRIEWHKFNGGAGDVVVEIYRLGHDRTDDYNCCIMPVDSDRFFATKEEAQAKLQELKGPVGND